LLALFLLLNLKTLNELLVGSGKLLLDVDPSKIRGPIMSVEDIDKDSFAGANILNKRNTKNSRKAAEILPIAAEGDHTDQDMSGDFLNEDSGGLINYENESDYTSAILQKNNFTEIEKLVYVFFCDYACIVSL
jgi:hypothetical protein